MGLVGMAESRGWSLGRSWLQRERWPEAVVAGKARPFRLWYLNGTRLDVSKPCGYDRIKDARQEHMR